MGAPQYPAEEARLAVLELYGQDRADPGLRELVAYAAEVCGVPVSLVSAVEADRQWFRAEIGFGRPETTRDESFCAHAMLQDGVFEVPDATKDARFADNPLVTGDPHIRFYAGAPIQSSEGLPLGSLCVIDTQPRELNDFQRRTLKLLASQAEARLELLRRMREMEAMREEASRGTEFLRAVTDGLPVRVAYVDREFRFRFMNDAYARETGLDLAASLGRTIAEAAGEPVFEAVRSNLERALRGETHVDEFAAPYPSGTRQVQVTYVPNRDAAGEVQGVIVQSLDVTEARRMERALASERARMGELLDKAPAFTALLEGPDLRFTFVNDEYRKLVGHRDVLGLPLREALPEFADQGLFEIVERVLATGEPFAGDELTIFLQNEPDGPLEERYLKLLYQAMRDGEGRIYGVFAHGVDVTSQVLAREAVAVEQARLRTIFEQAPAFIAVLSGPDLVFDYVNAAYYGIVGHRPLLGLPLVQAIPEVAGGGEGQDYDRVLGRVLETGERLTFGGRPAMLRRSPDAPLEERFLDLAYLPLREADGTVSGVLVHGIDVTDQVLARREIAAANEVLEARVADRTAQLQEAVHEAEAFNYSISHDLRTPLRAMVSTSSILLEELGPDLSSEHRDLLERQAHNANRLGKLIDELLRLSRLARAEVRRQPIDLTAKARSVAAELGAVDRVAVQEGMATEADPHLLRTVLQNLVGNALKFSPEGGTVWVGETDGTIWVRDEGIGFDMAHAKRMFLPFERLVAESEFAGTGIGLANVERIVKRHGGRVWAESEPGRGATFRLTLKPE